MEIAGTSSWLESQWICQEMRELKGKDWEKERRQNTKSLNNMMLKECVWCYKTMNDFNDVLYMLARWAYLKKGLVRMKIKLFKIFVTVMLIVISSKYPQNIPKMSPKYPKNILKISSKYPQNIPKISPKYPQNIPKISPKYPKNIPKISSKYPKNIPQDINCIDTV